MYMVIMSCFMYCKSGVEPRKTFNNDPLKEHYRHLYLEGTFLIDFIKLFNFM